VGREPIWRLHRIQKPLAVISNRTAIFVGHTARTVTERTELKRSTLLKFAYFCRYRDTEKRFENKRRTAKRNKGGDGEAGLHIWALLDYLTKTISYIYEWNEDDIDAGFDALNAAKLILKMEVLLKKVTELWHGHQVGTLSLTELRKNTKT
jgi:hypothetical protein